LGASGGPTEPAAALATTAEQALAGTSSVVAIKIVAAARSSHAGDGDTNGSNVMKAQKPGSP
jgi:hypothetical protein